ncbi:MAG TPA: alkaline phosphatase family protein [Vicinamibacterales bacterium]|nr:alkaline phosphatase family protein [Vicinamibacterales bacterium]
MTDDPRVDDLRRQLRSLGYLNAGVDRFVLGPARSARRPGAIAALAALRVGLIAAVLLGPAVAVGIGTRLPGLVTGPRDAAVVALYLGAMFGLAVSVFTFIASVTVARFAGVARRARLLSRVAGSLVAIGCLVYLTLWWRSANAGLAWSAPGWTAFALGIAVAISLLLGHAVAITAFAVIAAGRTGAGLSESASASGWRLSLVAGLAAFAGAAALLVLTAPSSSSSAPETSRPQLAVVSAGVRVKLIAIDGFDPTVFDRLAAEGRLPALSQLLAAGRVHVVPDELRDPARAWVTIATGQPPQVHGVHGLETRRVAGLQGAVASGDERGLGRAIRGATDLLRLTRPSVASRSELRAKTVWEIAADAGLRAAVVNWWATWPAGTGANEPTVISDRAVLRLERGGTLDAEIAPAQLYERLSAEWPAIKTESAALVRAFMPPATDPFTTAALGRSAELDVLQLALAARLQSEAPDLLAVYLPGLDIAQHTLLAPGNAASPSAMAARIDGLRAYYVFLDAVLKDVIVPRKDELIVLVTQPGRLSPDVQGLAGVTGGAAASRLDVQARGVDLAPTILHAVGIPVSRDLAGTPLVGVFSADFMRTFPVRYVPTYGPRSSRSSVRKGQPLDQEMIDRLRSLGYVR